MQIWNRLGMVCCLNGGRVFPNQYKSSTAGFTSPIHWDFIFVRLLVEEVVNFVFPSKPTAGFFVNGRDCDSCELKYTVSLNRCGTLPKHLYHQCFHQWPPASLSFPRQTFLKFAKVIQYCPLWGLFCGIISENVLVVLTYN